MQYSTRLFMARSGKQARSPAPRLHLPKQTHTLSPREIEVLTWAARGKSAGEISEILDIAKRTVDAHALSAVRKLGAVNRMHAVAIAVRDRLFEL